MLASAILTDVKNHGFSDVSDADLLIYLNYAYQDVNTLEAWPYLEKKLTGSFAATAAQFTATTDIKQILSLVNTARGYPLTPIRSDIFYKDYSSLFTLTGPAALYHTPTVNATAPNGLAVEVWPIPPVEAFQLRYIYIPATLTTSDTPVLPERFHRILTYGTLLQMYQLDDDTNSSIRFQGLFDRQLQRMRDDLWTQNFDQNDSIVDVSDYIDWGNTI